MKKFLAIVLTLLMVAAFAACTKTDVEPTDAISDGDVAEEIVTDEIVTDEVTEEDIVSDETASDDSAAVAALSAVWAQVVADEDLVAAFGAASSEEVAGYFAGGDSFTMGAPAAYAADADTLTYTFGVPAENTADVAEVATIMHMMNQNNLTAAAYTLNEGVDAAAFAASLKDGIASMQFLCGAPEQLIIADMDGVVIAAFGGADIINAFSAVLSAEGTVLVEDAIA